MAFKREDPMMNALEVPVTETRPFLSVSVPIRVLADLPSKEHQVTITCPWSSKPIPVTLSFQPPFTTSWKLLTAKDRKFIQISVSGQCDKILRCKYPQIALSDETKATDLNSPCVQTLTNGMQLSYMWELKSISANTQLKGDFSLTYSTFTADENCTSKGEEQIFSSKGNSIFDSKDNTVNSKDSTFKSENCTLNSKDRTFDSQENSNLNTGENPSQNSKDPSAGNPEQNEETRSKTEETRVYHYYFSVKDYETLYHVDAHIEPAKGSEFCRVGTLCHLNLCIRPAGRHLDEGNVNSLMYEVVAEQSLWAVCGRTAGVVSFETDSDPQTVVLDVMPLSSGYLPTPIVRLSKYIPADLGSSGEFLLFKF